MKWVIDLGARVFRDSVPKEVCKEIQKKNDDAHGCIDGCIEGAEKRTTARFAELKADMQRGFDEVKELIKERRV